MRALKAGSAAFVNAKLAATYLAKRGQTAIVLPSTVPA
jgi:hypothetical protein